MATPTDTDTTTARGQLMRRPLLLDPTLMRRLTPMDGTAMDMDTPTDTDTTMARGLLMMLPPLDPTLMLMPGTAMATTDTGLMDTDTATARVLLMRRLPPLDPTLMLRQTPMV